ncbi:MAG: DUF1553 domain-containing protein [Gemmataceae bacterium]|nr:DUF1553 domain-containing protein [Gemmataceae bacterium]
MRLAAFLMVLVAAAASAQSPVDFSRDVLPILSDNCFFCHGPDENARKAKLRLDTKEGAFRVRDGMAVIVPGKSDKSELIRRITSHEAEEMMPPAKSNRKLTAKQIDTLKRWVDDGAKWGQPWALTSLKKPTVPGPQSAAKPIDRFVREKLEKEGLKPSSETTRDMWLRRATLDLTGLPPTPKEMDEFLKDTSADAYAKAVDRLLASERYGERMTTDWLDIARFADTHGYQFDRARPVWPYRDWVIKAFNRNQRFDEFLTWQLAGDLLPNATKEQRLATAFNRLHMQNEEGGVVAEEFRVAYVVDRVTTSGTAFLGLTFECCRCHDHKYDPISQKDFYSLFSFFQNIDESGQTSYFTAATPVPALLLSTDEQDTKIAVMRRVMSAAERKLFMARTAATAGFEKWLGSERTLAPMGLVAHFSFDELKVNKITNSVDAKSFGNAHDGPKVAPGKIGPSAELNGENGFVFPGLGHFTRTDPFTFSMWLKTASHAPRATVLHHSQAPVDAGSRGYELLLENGNLAFGLHHMWPGNSLKVATKKAIPMNTWAHVTVTYDGSSTAEGLKIYLDGEAADVQVVRDNLRKDITYGGNEPNLAIGYRFRDNGFKGGTIDEFRVYNRALTSVEAAHVAGKTELGKVEGKNLFEYYAANVDAECVRATDELKTARRELNLLINPIAEIMVMEEMKEPKPAFILKRGDYDKHGDRVSAGTPAALPAFPANLPRNRLGLAKWLTQPDHPLTARVTVNRLWQQMFGKGIVETADNFGSTGSGPTHAELLDWLAADFVENDWDMKRTLKQIALSATYRQSAKVTPELLAKDPSNTLLARMTARRLTAEMLRDQALFVSGLLVEKQGGPSVYPYQPEGLWNEAMGRPGYPRSKGPDLYRRGMYTFWKRTAPPPNMTAFDAADRSVCNVKRQSTSTPLQALNLLNDPTFVEAARFLGQRMLKEGGKTKTEQTAWAFRLATSRTASEKETAILTKLFEEQAAAFTSDPKEAEKLLGVGDSKSDAALNKNELAAATAVALAILNHDAAVMRR